MSDDTLMTALWVGAVVAALWLLRTYMSQIVELVTNRHQTEEAFWNSLLTGKNPGVPMYWMRRFFAMLKADKRCKVCSVPFDGAGALPFGLLWSGQSNLTPHFCKKCEDFARRHVGGAEVRMTMLFVDVRGSTALGETMTATEFRALLNRFYRVATDVLTEHGAWLDKFVGDEAIGLFIPGFAGADHARLAVEAGASLLEQTGHDSEEGPWIPLGVGINTGVVFMGTVGSEKVADITALGDEMNVAARLSSVADVGDLVASEATWQSIDDDALRSRLAAETLTVSLKGKRAEQTVHVSRSRARAR